MENVFVDTNIVIDLLQKRDEFYNTLRHLNPSLFLLGDKFPNTDENLFKLRSFITSVHLKIYPILDGQ